MFSSSLFRSSARGAARVGRRFQSTAPSSGGSGIAAPLALVSLGGAAYVYLDSQSKVDELAAKVDSLQVELSGKTNSAFVFIKPHACKGKPGSVEAVVEDSFKEKGIRVTDKGEISAEEIDQKLLIDTHYGAIASKAGKFIPPFCICTNPFYLRKRLGIEQWLIWCCYNLGPALTRILLLRYTDSQVEAF